MRCEGVTAAGTPCKRPPVKGERYCAAHLGTASETRQDPETRYGMDPQTLEEIHQLSVRAEELRASKASIETMCHELGLSQREVWRLLEKIDKEKKPASSFYISRM